MVKTITIKDLLPLHTYQDVMKMYKYLLKKGDKDKLYFFKALVYAAFKHLDCRGWRKADEFLDEMCKPYIHCHTDKYHVFNNYYKAYKEGNTIAFGLQISDCIKQIL